MANMRSVRKVCQISPLNIPLVNERLQEHLFRTPLPNVDHSIMTSVRGQLRQMSVFNETCSTNDLSENIPLPALLADDIIQHTNQAAIEAIGFDFFERISPFLKPERLPLPPKEFVLDKGGWIKYEKGGTVEVDHPEESCLVFDTENIVTIGSCPVMNAAVSHDCWYTWINPKLFDDTIPTDEYLTSNDLINFGMSKQILIGHNVAFDRAKVKEEYQFKSEKTFIDTMSLHNALHGVSSKQMLVKMKSKSAALTASDRYLYGDAFEWLKHCSMSNLSDVFSFYHPAEPELNKDTRNVFVHGTAADIRENMHLLMEYNIQDVVATAKVFSSTMSIYLSRYPSPVNLFGMIQMGSPKMKINLESWNNYIDHCEKSYIGMKDDLEKKTLPRLAISVFDRYKAQWYRAVKAQLEGPIAQRKMFNPLDNKYEWNSDPYLKCLDWSPATKKNPLPKWIKPIMRDKRVSINNRVIPMLIRLEWKGHRVIHSKDTGWAHVNSDGVSLTPLPHDKAGQKVGMLMTTAYSKHIINNNLRTNSNKGKQIIKDIMEVNTKGSYWRTYRERFRKLLIIKDEKTFNWHLPQQVPHGTVTRRAKDSFWMVAQADSGGEKLGTGAFELSQLPKGYVYVSADVDSQEIWIASLFADMYKQLGEVGVTGLSYMTLNGSKAAGNDIHTITANAVGMDRHSAKILNYARLYLCGKQNAMDLLGPRDGAQQIVDNLWKLTKGTIKTQKNPLKPDIKPFLQKCQANLKNLPNADDVKTFTFLLGKLSSDIALLHHEQTAVLRMIHNLVPDTKNFLKEIDDLFDAPRRVYVNGIESDLFNYLMTTAIQRQPTTPVLGGNLPKPLLNRHAPTYVTTRCNWLIQSSAVDFLHLFLVNMNYLIRLYDIDAVYSLSIHDMIQFISSEEDKHRTALAFQIAHMHTRAYFTIQCGLNSLPQNVAFFSSVEIDRSMRKQKDTEWNELYGENPGTAEELNISEIIELCNGSLTKSL